MAAEPKLDIPILTDAVDRSALRRRGLSAEREAMIAELQTEIAAGMFTLTDEILRRSLAGIEASIFEQVSARLRSELPEMIDAMLRARLDDSSDY